MADDKLSVYRRVIDYLTMETPTFEGPDPVQTAILARPYSGHYGNLRAVSESAMYAIYFDWIADEKVLQKIRGDRTLRLLYGRLKRAFFNPMLHTQFSPNDFMYLRECERRTNPHPRTQLALRKLYFEEGNTANFQKCLYHPTWTTEWGDFFYYTKIYAEWRLFTPHQNYMLTDYEKVMHYMTTVLPQNCIEIYGACYNRPSWLRHLPLLYFYIVLVDWVVHTPDPVVDMWIKSAKNDPTRVNSLPKSALFRFELLLRYCVPSLLAQLRLRNEYLCMKRSLPDEAPQEIWAKSFCFGRGWDLVDDETSAEVKMKLNVQWRRLFPNPTDYVYDTHCYRMYR